MATWQSRNYVIAGGEICDNIRWCELRPVKHARGVSPIWHIVDNPGIREEIRHYIANHLGVNIEQIDTNIRIPVGDFITWQGTGHFREAIWVRFAPNMDMTSKRGSLFKSPPQRWDIYNIGYSYREPDLEGGYYILNEIAPILDIIPQITSYQSSNSSYAHKIPKRVRRLLERIRKFIKRTKRSPKRIGRLRKCSKK